MILQLDVAGAVYAVRPSFLVAEDSWNFHAVLSKHSVVQNGDLCLLGNVAVLEAGGTT